MHRTTIMPARPAWAIVCPIDRANLHREHFRSLTWSEPLEAPLADTGGADTVVADSEQTQGASKEFTSVKLYTKEHNVYSIDETPQYSSQYSSQCSSSSRDPDPRRTCPVCWQDFTEHGPLRRIVLHHVLAEGSPVPHIICRSCVDTMERHEEEDALQRTVVETDTRRCCQVVLIIVIAILSLALSAFCAFISFIPKPSSSQQFSAIVEIVTSLGTFLFFSLFVIATAHAIYTCRVDRAGGWRMRPCRSCRQSRRFFQRRCPRVRRLCVWLDLRVCGRIPLPRGCCSRSAPNDAPAELPRRTIVSRWRDADLRQPARDAATDTDTGDAATDTDTGAAAMDTDTGAAAMDTDTGGTGVAAMDTVAGANDSEWASSGLAYTDDLRSTQVETRYVPVHSGMPFPETDSEMLETSAFAAHDDW